MLRRRKQKDISAVINYEYDRAERDRGNSKKALRSERLFAVYFFTAQLSEMKSSPLNPPMGDFFSATVSFFTFFEACQCHKLLKTRPEFMDGNSFEVPLRGI